MPGRKVQSLNYMQDIKYIALGDICFLLWKGTSSIFSFLEQKYITGCSSGTENF